jgi:hypothetical protein
MLQKIHKLSFLNFDEIKDNHCPQGTRGQASYRRLGTIDELSQQGEKSIVSEFFL